MDLEGIRGSEHSKPRLLALSSPGGFSGFPEAVLGGLRQYYEIVSVVDGLKTPKWARLSMLARSFRPRRADWGRRYYAAMGKYTKKPSTFLARIRRCERELANLASSYDAIYQFGALFGVLERPVEVPLILHIDFTTRLAEKYYPAWLPESPTDTEEWYLIEERIYRSADLVLTPTELVAESLSDHYGVAADRIAVVGMGAHVEDLSGDFAKPQNRMLVFAGPDFERHGGELALQIFEGVRERCPDANLITVSNRSVDVPGIRNLGIVSRERLHEVLKGAAVLLMPGAVGGYQTVTEAMAAKCLCVTAEGNPHMHGLIRNGDSGLTVRPKGAARAAEALMEYLDTPERLAAMGERARRYVVQECSWPGVLGRIRDQIGARFFPVEMN